MFHAKENNFLLEVWVKVGVEGNSWETILNGQICMMTLSKKSFLKIVWLPLVGNKGSIFMTVILANLKFL